MALLNLRYTLAQLYAARRIQPIIVVAIPTNEDRLHEYGTAVTVNAQGLGSKAAAYTRFLVEEVRPVIDREFRTVSGPENTAILGASLGGLSAFDIAWNHPEVFGSVGVFSGSFWWRASAADLQITPNALIMHAVVRRSQKRAGFRAWFQAATRDEVCDRDGNGVIDAIQDTLELMDELALLGYRPGVDMLYVEVKGGRHDYDTWTRVLADFLQWAFPL
jgi:enterochelin esterase-like enzyme